MENFLIKVYGMMVFWLINSSIYENKIKFNFFLIIYMCNLFKIKCFICIMFILKLYGNFILGIFIYKNYMYMLKLYLFIELYVYIL